MNASIFVKRPTVTCRRLGSGAFCLTIQEDGQEIEIFVRREWGGADAAEAMGHLGASISEAILGAIRTGPEVPPACVQADRGWPEPIKLCDNCEVPMSLERPESLCINCRLDLDDDEKEIGR